MNDLRRTSGTSVSATSFHSTNARDVKRGAGYTSKEVANGVLVD